MDLKIVCITFLALAIISAEATGLSNTNTATAPEVTTSNLGTGAVANLRSKRQYFGGNPAFSSAQASASAGSFGGGFNPYGGGGIASSFANANAGSFGK